MPKRTPLSQSLQKASTGAMRYNKRPRKHHQNTKSLIFLCSCLLCKYILWLRSFKNNSFMSALYGWVASGTPLSFIVSPLQASLACNKLLGSKEATVSSSTSFPYEQLWRSAILSSITMRQKKETCFFSRSKQTQSQTLVHQ